LLLIARNLFFFIGAVLFLQKGAARTMGERAEALLLCCCVLANCRRLTNHLSLSPARGMTECSVIVASVVVAVDHFLTLVSRHKWR